MDLGILVLRVVVGLIFAAHGAQKLFGWFDGPGPQGTAGWLASMGYRPPKVMAFMSGATESVGGLLLAAGLVTPLAAAMIIGQMLNAIGSAHWDKGFWVTNGGYEYPVVISVVGAAVAFTGPGRYSLDYALGFDLDGSTWGFLAVAVGLVTGLVVLGSRETQRIEQSAADEEDRRAA